MSRAFVKESDSDELLNAPARRHSEHPNYITPAGERSLRQRVADLNAARAELAGDHRLESKTETRRIDTDLEYFTERLRRVIPVLPPPPPWTHVRIGAEVELLDAQGCTHRFRVVGEDEADVKAGQISWTSPLGSALLGRALDDVVTWPRRDGSLEVEIAAIAYR